jgi:hypothetical protein
LKAITGLPYSVATANNLDLKGPHFLRHRNSLVCLLAVAASTISTAAEPPRASTATPTLKDARKQFVLDVVKNAVALPQSDPQDRLRVLHSAVTVVAPVSRKMAQTLSREGVQLEAELIRAGQKPAISLFAAGNVDCASAANFVQMLPASAVQTAEQPLIGALSFCPKQALEPARQKLETALNSGILAARPLLAVIEAVGTKAAWSQIQFAKMFGALPTDYDQQRSEAPNFAAMYVRVAPDVDTSVARDTGLKFLEWLSHLQQGGERNLSVNMVTATMQQVLGAEKYGEALRSNVVAAGMARTAGQPGEIPHAEEESVSVLRAMGNTGQDLTDAIRAMPSSRRAREAAAHGFAAGHQGDRKMADRYFDIAFSAVNEAWKDRKQGNAAAVVAEVSEAAAQVDAVAALTRAQGLQDPSAQAIGMLAVARVVLGQQN